jgi:transposase
MFYLNGQLVILCSRIRQALKSRRSTLEKLRQNSDLRSLVGDVRNPSRVEGSTRSLRDDGRALNSGDSVRFLRHLRQQLKCKLLVAWDGSPIHRNEVRTYLANRGANYIHLEQLPAYAPDLNPDEGGWQNLKRVELANIPCQNLFQLRRELSLAFMRLRSRPHVIRSFFAEAGLSIER